MAKMDYTAIKALEWKKFSAKGGLSAAICECVGRLFAFSSEGTIHLFDEGITDKDAAAAVKAAENTSEIGNSEIVASMLDEDYDQIPTGVVIGDVEDACGAEIANALKPYIEAMSPLYEYTEIE